MRALLTGIRAAGLGLVVAACGSAAVRQGEPVGAGGSETVVRPGARLTLSQLEAALRERIAREGSGEVGVALTDLGTGLELDIASTVEMHAASTMKVPVMLEVFRQAERGRFSLDDAVAVRDSFRSIVGDTVYRLTPASDSDSTLHTRVGSTATVRELVRLMITRSSNLALNLLIERVGADAVTETVREIGADGIVVRRGVEDLPAFRRGLNNTTDARAYAIVLEAIARCTITTRSSCDEMIDILAAQEFDEMLPAGLPAGTRIAHKTGWITGIQHDGGIVFPGRRPPYVLAILTRGFEDTARAARLGAELSRLVWQQLTDASFSPTPRVADSGTRELLELHARYRADEIAQRHFGAAALWRAVEPHVGARVRAELAGRSVQGRPIRLLSYGNGPTAVLLWSQMHGDEATATMALVDLVRYLAGSAGDARTTRWAERLTVLMIPMVNPDGAELFQRYNAYGVDVNRDARALATPEAQTLKSVRDRFRPAFGFNLHDQNTRTRVGSSTRTAAIALLAPPPDDEPTQTAGFVRAQQLAAAIRLGLDPLVGGHIAQYDDTFNPRAFGDLMQAWGTSTVLIESGGWLQDPEKQYLRAVNFAAIVRALDTIADSSYLRAPIAAYVSLPRNGQTLNDLLIRGGSLALPGLPPVRADVSADLEGGHGRPLRARITEVGDLRMVEARDTVDVPGLFLHPSRIPPTTVHLSPGVEADFEVRTGPEPGSETVLRIRRGVVKRM